MTTTRMEHIEGLRAIADWFEAHPEVPLPPADFSCYHMNSKQEAAVVLKALTPATKTYDDDMFGIERHFGPVRLRFVFYRREICKAKVVGKKLVPEQIEPERIIPEKVIPEHEEDIIEWDCSARLLSLPTDEEVEAA